VLNVFDRQTRLLAPSAHLLRRMAMRVGRPIPIEIDVVHLVERQVRVVEGLGDGPVEEPLQRHRAGGDAEERNAFRQLDVGVNLSELFAETRAYVAAITPNAGAERAGIRKGDVMIEVDGVGVRSNDDVVRIVRKHRPGDALRVVVLRGDEQKTFEVTLGDLPNA